LSDLPADEKFRDVAYNKGFFVWDMLSREIGRRKFQHILRNITRRYAFQRLTIKELWRAIEANAGRDLSWFYNQWFERMGAPDFHLTWKQEGTVVHGAITQRAPYYRATLEVELAGDNEQRFSRSVRVNGPQTRFVLSARFRVGSVTLDPHYLVLRWTPEYRNVGNRQN
jgi:aminopeptidase N